MRSLLLQFSLLVLLLTAVLGCSGGGSPVAPEMGELTPARDVDSTGHVIWGAWDFTVDRDTLDITIEPMRSMEHYNITQFVMPPNCNDCIQMLVEDVDLTNNIFSVRVILRNPTSLAGYDVRGIVFIKPGQELLSADNWTALHDQPGNYDRNPFQAFAKEWVSRCFAAGATNSATYRLVLPPGNMSVSFAVDASWPEPCPEPYEMKVANGIDFLDNFGSYSEKLDVYAKGAVAPWDQIQLDCSSLGAPAPLELLPDGTWWTVKVSNDWGAAPGFYTAWLQGRGETGPWIYEPVEIEVKAFGPDRLETLLGTMHNWSNGNPNETLTKDNFKYEGSDLTWIIDDMGHGNTRLPYYNSIHRQPLSTVPYCMGLLDAIESQTVSQRFMLSSLLTIGSDQLGETFTPVSYCYYCPSGVHIAEAMAALYDDIGESLSQPEKDAIAAQTETLPLSLQIITAAMLRAVGVGYEDRQNAISGYDSDTKNVLFNNGTDWVYGTSIYFAVLDEAAAFDYQSMYRAASPVFQAVDQTRNYALYYVPQPTPSWEWDTPLGKVKIGSSENDMHSDDNYLLLVDPGGDDTYDCQAGANNSLDNPFSICIDLAGDDDYLDQGDTNYAQGAGRMGVGLLWDCYGDDTYDNYRGGQGFGHWGVGALIDSAGNDTYNCDGTSQGSGYMGIGILVDEWGNDTYDCYHFSQGFGFVKGWGLAYDAEGNDRWTANDSDIIYPSPQTEDHNTSMAQGQGYGLRWDSQTTFQSGGQGILFDKAGDDEYSCGVFGSGCAYWFGTGIFADYGGQDTNYGIWYVNGATAHYGTAFFIAKGGENDSYTATTGVGVGGGHDFSNTFFFDEGGDDTYTSAAHSLGGGNECGVGVFVDYMGNDQYNTTHTGSMGNGYFSDGRDRGSWGLFIELGGTDTYMSEKQTQGCGNNSTWNINDIGAGGDFEGGIVVWQ